MDIALQNKYATKITARMAEIRAQLAEPDGIAKPVSPDSAIGRLSRVDAMQLQEMRRSLVQQRQDELVRLEHALNLIAKGRYGVCNGCEEDIPEKRLDAVPDAQMCVPCLSAIQQRR